MTNSSASRPHVAVIGGGPAGLMAAETLSAAGARVTVYDRMPSLGRKFLMAGRGGLNLTHSEPLDTFRTRYGDAAMWLSPLIERFDNTMVRSWCEGLGQPTFIGSSGRIFPAALKASPLLRAWLSRLARDGVEFALRRTWVGIKDDGSLCFARADRGQEVVRPDATILALGGASWPRLGADGGWVDILRAHGVAVRDLLPANVGVTVDWTNGFVERFAGTPLKTVTVRFAGDEVRGDLVVTGYGLEGGPVYRLGSAVRAALRQRMPVSLMLDLRPDTSRDLLANRLARATAKGRSRGDALRRSGLLPVAIALLREAAAGLPAEAPALADLVKAVPVPVTGLQPITRAISSAGGIEQAALDGNLMLRHLPGVFAAGEMLDWEAPTGGYLLQACFATGRAAAEGALAWLEHRRGGC